MAASEAGAEQAAPLMSPSPVLKEKRWQKVDKTLTDGMGGGCMSDQPWSLLKAEEHLASRAISSVGVSKHLPSKGLWCSRSPWPRSCSTISIQWAHQMTSTFYTLWCLQDIRRKKIPVYLSTAVRGEVQCKKGLERRSPTVLQLCAVWLLLWGWGLPGKGHLWGGTSMGSLGLLAPAPSGKHTGAYTQTVCPPPPFQVQHPAGTGKQAIQQTLLDTAYENHYHLSTFFFFVYLLREDKISKLWEKKKKSMSRCSFPPLLPCLVKPPIV